MTIKYSHLRLTNVWMQKVVLDPMIQLIHYFCHSTANSLLGNLALSSIKKVNQKERKSGMTWQ